MDSTIAKVGSEALYELKKDLTNLSRTLHQIYELMQADMRQVNAAWQDSKYQEFVDNYQPQIQKCDEISNRYAEWCARVLDPTIENVIAVETADVVGGESLVGGGSTDAAFAGGTVVGAAAVGAVGAVAGVGVASKGESDQITGSDSAAHSNSDESDMEKRFHELYPDASPEFAKTYFELSPEQRMEYSKEYLKLKNQHDYDVFRAEDRIKMGREISGDGGRAAGAFWAGKGVYDGISADKKYEEGMRKLEESTMEHAGIGEPRPTTKAVPISNGCGSEEDPKSFAAASVGRAMDTKLKTGGRFWEIPAEWKAQGESCDIHDKCYYNGEGKEKCDVDFQRRSPIMGTAVRMAEETSGKSYEQAQKDRILSKQLQSTWEKEHGRSLDAENFRVVPND